MAEPEGFSAYDADDLAESVEYNASNYHEGNGADDLPGRHAKFLDLTNGAGGAKGHGGGGGSLHGDGHSDTYNDDDDRSNTGSQTNNDAVDALMDAHIRAATNRDAQRGTVRVDPNTPGKVVEAGQEHTGRWTKEEHEAFLSALQMYGKEWKKVAAKVKTRTVVQTRTHAQKYFQKLQKAMEGNNGEKGDVSHVDMGVAPEAKKSSTRKKRGNTPSIASKPRQTPPPPPQHQQQQQQQQQQEQQQEQPLSKLASFSASNFLSNLTTAAQSIQTPTATNTQAITASSAFGSGAMAGPPASLSRPQQQTFPPRHGFSTGSEAYRPASYGSSSFGGFGGSDGGWGASGSARSMKITAPDPEASSKRGDFPEPSPAACGKRKLAEIAAARMLAGVAGGGKSLLSSAVGEDPDGDVTPPPQSPREREKPGPPGLTLSDVPAPPLMNSSQGNNSSFAPRKGLSLQIVNPETFGDPYEEQKRRRADGEGSPVTPWDGQLEALVSEKAKKSEELQRQEEDADTKLPQLPGLSSHIASKHPVCNHPSSYSRTALHKAICEVDLENIQRELSTTEKSNENIMSRRDDAGFCPIHSACALKMLKLDRPDAPIEIVRQLVVAGGDPSCLDGKGNTPLHWAARAGDKAVAEFLISKNCPIDAKNENFETPLHWAMRAGRAGMEVVAVLLENGARVSSLNKLFKRPVDIAADGFDDEPGSTAPRRQIEKPNEKKKRVTKEEKRMLLEISGERKEVRANLLLRSPQSKTLVLHHAECLEHTTKSESDWEAPDRITAILNHVTNRDGNPTSNTALMPYELTLSTDFERAKLDLLSKVHSTDYLAFVNDLSKDLERRHKQETSADDSDPLKPPGTLTPPVVPFTPMVQRSMIKIEESRIKLGDHSDTSFSVGSLRAARRAAGAVQHAVDCVLIGRNRNAMCVVRPPGHHAGVNGLLDGGESCGFCIFNNVAAGALHAISDERLLCERCAIVDIDVHHGNGTEEIVRKCHDPGKLFFFSIHLYDNDKKKQKGNAFQYKFYPGTGAEDDVAFNIINVALSPLWKEPQEKPAITHNTRQKTRAKVAVNDSMDDSASDIGTPRERDGGRSSDADSETASSSNNKDRSAAFSLSNSSSGRLAYRQAIQNRLLPALRAFNPDLILISAGFDAARADVGNARHERSGERMGLDLEPEDYAWTTRKILEVADICCQGRVVSVLEGGYGRTPANGESTLDRSNLAECAARHLHAMVDPYDCEGRFSC